MYFNFVNSNYCFNFINSSQYRKRFLFFCGYEFHLIKFKNYLQLTILINFKFTQFSNFLLFINLFLFYSIFQFIIIIINFIIIIIISSLILLISFYYYYSVIPFHQFQRLQVHLLIHNLTKHYKSLD